ncbi:MAG: ATP-binding protein [Gammaproteobacteria bacterium]|nr:ATP-binding protein [Gammaproteobacteria bacterium]
MFLFIKALVKPIKHKLTLKLSITLLLVGVGLLSLTSLFFTSSQSIDIALENEQTTFNEIIHLRIVDKLKELRKISRKMGESLRKEPGLLEAIDTQNITKISQVLDDQFSQYFTTAGVLKLEKILIMDKNARIITQSNLGYKTETNTVPICNNIIETVMHRKGASRLKTKSGLCKHEGITFFGAMMPISGLVPKSFALIIVDPTYTIKNIETDFGDPIRITQADGSEVYRSPLWPTASAMDSFRILRHEHEIHDISDTAIYNDKIAENAFTYDLARNTSEFENRFGNAIYISTIISVLIILIGVLISLFLLHVALTPLQKLQQSSSELSHGEYIPLEESFFPEINTVTNSFNKMANDISHLIEDLQIAYDRADNASKIKSQFLANMSHEIRTPLTAVLGYADALYDSNLDDIQRSQLETIITSGSHLREIINDILDLSKIEAGKLDLEKTVVSPLDILSNIASIFSHQIKNKGLDCIIKFSYPIPQTITTDAMRTRQILLNLMSNSMKFTTQGSITIETGFDQETHLLSIKVSDTGIGMSPEEMNKIFKPFTQADASTTRKYGGTGLGLTLSSQLAKMLGGELIVESKKDNGSCFTLTIATGEVDNFIYEGARLNIESHIETEANKRQFHAKVLLAEDTPALQDLITLHLKKMGIDVTLAENGKQAMELATENEFDLILMDMQMPVMSGIDAVKNLRSNGYSKPIIAMTANAMRGDQELYMQIGCNDYVAKPIDKQRFRKALETYLKQENSQTVEIIISDILKDEPDLYDILIKFVDSLPGILNEIEQAYNDKDWTAISNLVHALKGTGGGYGYPQITDTCIAIEKKITSEEYAQIQSDLETLRTIINGVRLGLKKSA